MAIRIWSMISSMRSSSTITLRVRGMLLLSLNNSSNRSINCRISINASVKRMTSTAYLGFAERRAWSKVYLHARHFVLQVRGTLYSIAFLIAQRVGYGLSIPDHQDFFFQGNVYVSRYHARDVPCQRSNFLYRAGGK